MPTRKPTRRSTTMSVQEGKGILDIFKSINRIARKTKAISTLAGLAGAAGVPYAAKIGGVAGSLGYGKKKAAPKKKRSPAKKKGRGLNPGGNGLSLAGQKNPYR